MHPAFINSILLFYKVEIQTEDIRTDDKWCQHPPTLQLQENNTNLDPELVRQQLRGSGGGTQVMLVFIAFFHCFLYLYLFYWRERKRERIMLLSYFATTLSELSQINIQYSHKISWFFIWLNADFSRRDFFFFFL